MPELPDFPAPKTGLLACHLVVTRDVGAAVDFYGRQLGGEVVIDTSADGGPVYVRLANTWVIVVTGGDGTPDKPSVTLAPPTETERFDSFLNLRAADIWSTYREWLARGVRFETPPLDNGGWELRCYARDPDGRIVELGQHTGMLDLVAQRTGAAPD